MLYYFVFNRKGDTMDTYYEDIPVSYTHLDVYKRQPQSLFGYA